LEAKLNAVEKSKTALEQGLRSQLSAAETAHEKTRGELQIARDEIKRLQVWSSYGKLTNF
jgi:hypothetical protein